MAYTRVNYKTKKVMIDDFKAGKGIEVFQPGMFGPEVKDGQTNLEGPHYPETHRWYASAEVKDGIIIKVK